MLEQLIAAVTTVRVDISPNRPELFAAVTRLGSPAFHLELLEKLPSFSSIDGRLTPCRRAAPSMAPVAAGRSLTTPQPARSTTARLHAAPKEAVTGHCPLVGAGDRRPSSALRRVRLPPKASCARGASWPAVTCAPEALGTHVGRPEKLCSKDLAEEVDATTGRPTPSRRECLAEVGAEQRHEPVRGVDAPSTSPPSWAPTTRGSPSDARGSCTRSAGPGRLS